MIPASPPLRGGFFLGGFRQGPAAANHQCPVADERPFPETDGENVCSRQLSVGVLLLVTDGARDLRRDARSLQLSALDVRKSEDHIRTSCGCQRTSDVHWVEKKYVNTHDFKFTNFTYFTTPSRQKIAPPPIAPHYSQEGEHPPARKSSPAHRGTLGGGCIF